MQRLGMIIGVALLLAQIPGEQQAKADLYHQCLYDRAAALDDGTSDAMTIGVAIAPLCRAQLEEAAGKIAAGQNRRVQSYVVRNMMQDEVKTAAGVVLVYRRDRRKL